MYTVCSTDIHTFPPITDAGEFEMDDEDEYAHDVTQEDIDKETAEKSTVMECAEAWQHFFEYVEMVQTPWAPEDEDTNEYRMKRAVELYNSGEPTPTPSAATAVTTSAPNSLLVLAHFFFNPAIICRRCEGCS